MATKREELIKQRAEEADRMIADLSAPAAPAQDNADTQQAIEADAAAQPTSVDTDTATPMDDQGAQSVDTPPNDPAVSGGELDALRAEVTRLNGELTAANARYSTLQGMINARNQDIAELRGIIATLSTQQPAAKEPEAQVTTKDVEEYGEEMIELIRRVARGEVSPFLQSVDAKVDKVARVATATAEQRFESDLASLVPDWESINDDPAFVSWLGKYNVKALNEAYSNMDAEGTAKFFLDYKKLTAPPPEPVVIQQPVVAAPSPAAKLETLAAPSKSKVAALPFDANQGKVWTPAEITKMYRDFAEKKISAAEFNKLEADIFKAQREGRVAA